MRHAIAYAETRPATITYALFADLGDADVLWGVHLYADRAAFDTHRASDALAATHEALEPCLAIPFEVVKTVSIGGKGLPTVESAVSGCAPADPRLGVLVRIAAVAGGRPALAEALADLRQEAEREAGTLLYHLFADAGDPDLLWAFHLYADQAAFEVHRGSATLKAVQTRIRPLLAYPYEVRKLAPIAGKGLPC